jgi:phage terminase large subunit
MSDVSLPDWAECLLTQGPRYTILHGGRGSAKSMSVGTALPIRAAAEPLRVLCCREIQQSIQESVKSMLESRMRAMDLAGSFYDIQKSEINGANGSKFIFRGLSDITADSIKSLDDIDIVWVEEAQVLSQRSLDLLLPTIRKETSEIWMTLNPELDTDPVYTTFIEKPPANARVIQVNWNRNPFWNSALEAERLRSQADDPERYDHIWEGVPLSAASGAIYRVEMHALSVNNRIRPIAEDPALTTHAVFDLGVADLTSITIAQADISGLRVLAFHEDHGLALKDYSDWLRQNGWGHCTIWLPHDGRARSLHTGMSSESLMKSYGWNVQIVPSLPVETGIQNARAALKNAFVSDDNGCGVLLEHLRRYTRNKAGHPQHDEHSHAADSFRYTAIAMGHFKAAAERVAKQADLAARVKVIPTVNHWGSVNR